MVRQFPSDVHETKCHVKSNRCGGGNGGDNGRPCLTVELVNGRRGRLAAGGTRALARVLLTTCIGGELVEITASKNFLPSLRNDHTDLAQQGRVKVTEKEMAAGHMLGSPRWWVRQGAKYRAPAVENYRNT